jgi:uncharacterized membrane protein
MQRRWVRAACAVLILLGGTSMAMAQRADDEANSEVTVCNKTPDAVTVIFIHRHFYEAKMRMLSGWYNVGPKACAVTESFPRGPIYVYAEKVGKPVQWRGTDAYACLARRPTERTLYDNETCMQGEEKRGFFIKQADKEKLTITLNP